MKVRLSNNSNWLSESGYTIQEQHELYQQQLQELLDDPGYYLDHFEWWPEYRLNRKCRDFILIGVKKENLYK